MQKMYQHIMKAICCLLVATAVASCALIDDDLSECGTDYELDYELQLVTNMNTELKTQLATNVNVSNALRTQLSSIFTDFAHDVDLSILCVCSMMNTLWMPIRLPTNSSFPCASICIWQQPMW